MLQVKRTLDIEWKSYENINIIKVNIWNKRKINIVILGYNSTLFLEDLEDKCIKNFMLMSTIYKAEFVTSLT